MQQINTPNQFKIENILLLLLLGIGICGFFYTYHYSTPSKQEIIWSQTGKVEKLVMNDRGDLLKDLEFKVGKNQEAGLPVEFYIEGFNEFANFIIDLGNGQELTAQSERVSFTYTEAGTYQVSLKVTNEQTEQVLQQKTLKIRGENLVAGR